MLRESFRISPLICRKIKYLFDNCRGTNGDRKRWHTTDHDRIRPDHRAFANVRPRRDHDPISEPDASANRDLQVGIEKAASRGTHRRGVCAAILAMIMVGHDDTAADKHIISDLNS